MKRKATEVGRKQVEERRKLAEVKRKEKLARRKVTEERRMDRMTEIYELDELGNSKIEKLGGI